MNKYIDIVIYGATGFTGQLCMKYFQSLDLNIKWAIAGRNHEKLKTSKKSVMGILSSASFWRGNQVDGLPRPLTFEF